MILFKLKYVLYNYLVITDEIRILTELVMMKNILKPTNSNKRFQDSMQLKTNFYLYSKQSECY